MEGGGFEEEDGCKGGRHCLGWFWCWKACIIHRGEEESCEGVNAEAP